jgi:hypothetical protein
MLGIYGIGADRIANSTECSAATTVPTLENVSSKSSWPDRAGGILYRSDNPAASLVCLPRGGASPREVLHFNVTDHPTSEWVAQRIPEAFADREAPRYLSRDRDGAYGEESVGGWTR